MESQQFFESDQQVAAYLGLTLPAFLALRNEGRLGVCRRPKDPTLVYFVEDIDRWIASGRPVSNQTTFGPRGDVGINFDGSVK